ncbi:MAG: prefoldin subunit beta [Candidatus Nanoarchaeia archaeon]|nr:prefoldin subunit beta [Candidatus Nanoarchaeia archaeon]
MKDDKEKNTIMQFQQTQQQVQILMMQKQNLQIQLNEVENALEEISKSEGSEVYQMVGTIMIKKDIEKIKKELDEKKETVALRVSVVDKQIEKFNTKLIELQKSLKGG